MAQGVIDREGGRSSNPGASVMRDHSHRSRLLDATPELVIGPRSARTRWRGMTAVVVAASFIALGAITMSTPALADTVQLYAAGSLKAALTDVAKAFEATSGNTVQTKFGASGLLKDEIAGGAKADLFASANMEHPQALHDAGKSGAVTLFARNRLCALVRPGLKVDSAGLLERMLDPQIKLGTSTPKADPAGDYAFALFAKADAIKTGARAELEHKALQLTGGRQSAAAPPNRNIYGWHVAESRADIFLTYCTNALVARQENPGQQVVALPDSLAVGADYGMTVMNGASAAAQHFAQFIVAPDGQRILAGHGFSPVTAK